MDQCVRTRRPRARAAVQEAGPAAAACAQHDLAGILERDQRTVRVATTLDTRIRTLRLRRARRWCQCQCQCQCQWCECSQRAPALVCEQCRIPFHTKRSSSSSSRSTSARYPPRSTVRWLVATLCVLALLPLPPRAMAAPAPATSPTSAQHPRPKWINPCGVNKQDLEQELEHEYLNVPAVTVADLMQQIVVQAKNALMHAEQFREKYVRRTFDVGFDEHHRSWKDYKYDWLPTIPKQLGDRAEEEHLQKQNLEDALRDIYQYLQQYAVGLEQIVWDQVENEGDFREEFKKMEFKLRSVLCEVQVAMAEQSVTQHPDVTRDIMASEFRDMQHNASYRHLRDWIILRDYMNGLEYVIQLFEHFNRPQVLS